MRTANTSLAILLAGLWGCTPQEEAAREEFFPPLENSATSELAAMQASRGARSDATLNPIHFDGAGLNSLGREKLNAMLMDADSSLPMTVYVNLKEADPHTAARRSAVGHHLADRGLKTGQFKVEPGINPGTLHPATPEIERAVRTESTGASGSASNPPAAGNSAAGANQTK